MTKRMEAGWAIVGHSSVNSIIAAPPTVGFEAHKHIILKANEVLMCLSIAKIYSGTSLSEDNVIELLKEAGLVIVVGGTLAWAVTELAHITINEILNFLGPYAWLGKGLLAGSLTASIGVAFIIFCEERYGK